MIFYNGFSLKNDNIFFKEYYNNTRYTVAGFSYGAIKAFEFALTCNTRIDKLQLFSPAFFQNMSNGLKQKQILLYEKNKKLYLKYFIQNCFKPYSIKPVQQTSSTTKGLNELLNYEWKTDSLKKLVDNNINIEVYVGTNDHIIDTHIVQEFFLPFSTIYLIKNANHFLQLN